MMAATASAPAAMPDAGPVLLLEDDQALADALATSLRLSGHTVTISADAAAALAAIDRRYAGVIVSDLRMPGMDGWQFFAGLKDLDADIPLIFMTGHGNIDQAVAALRDGAYDFLAKPFPPDRLLASVSRAIEKRRLVLDNRRLRAAAADAAADPFAGVLALAGESPAMQALRATLAQVLDADIDALIEAEPGCGRDRVARLLHDNSRRQRAFTSLHCAAAPPAELAADLFGRPASGGRARPASGRLALARQGTLFLDAIEALPLDLQVRLLAALAGGRDEADVRVIAAIGTSPDQAVADGRLQPELALQLGALRLRIPPLRERRDDLPMLFAQLAAQAASRFNQPMPPISASLRAHLLSKDWPGNLAELSHVAQRFVLGLEPGSAAVAETEGGTTLAERLARVESALLREALAAEAGRINAVAARLGLPRKTLYDKLTRHGINPASYRRAALGKAV